MNTSVFAQLYSNEPSKKGLFSNKKIIADTSKKKQIKIDNHVKIVYHTLTDTTLQLHDTSISTIHRNPLQSVWHKDLGNTGSCSQSILFIPILNPSFQLGIISKHPILYKWTQQKFYNTTKPYTDIYYRNGSKQDQILSFLHTQNILPNWNMSVQYRKINSPGFYKWQKTNHDNASLNTNYKSKNKKSDFKSGFIFNKLQQDENGGITSYQYLYASNYNDKRLVPVNIENKTINQSTVANTYRNYSFHTQYQYFFGKIDSVYNADSTVISENFKSKLSLKHQFYLQKEFAQYKDFQPDSIDYPFALTQQLIFGDSVYAKNIHTQIGNTFSVNKDIIVKNKIMQASAGIGLEMDYIKNNEFKKNYTNNFIFASIQKPTQSQQEWIFDGHFTFYYTGYNIGNLLLQAKTGRSISAKKGTLLFGYQQSIQSAPYTYTAYVSNYFNLKSSFDKQIISDVNASYINSFYKTQIDFHYYLIGNYFYRDTQLIALQYKKIIPVYQLHVQKKWQYKSFIFDNEILLQSAPVNTPIHLPLLTSIHRIALEHKVLKQKLSIATGIECRYHTPYFANDYAPQYFGFVTQYAEKINNVPELIYFFNFKVKRFRSSLCFDQLQQLFTRNHINYPNYASQNFSFRFGLYWVFVN